jgi:CubicO group peptidase (beta-lactamase class C family)
MELSSKREAAGMTGLEQYVQRFVDRLEREQVNIHGFQLSVRGEMKAKAYYAPFAEGQLHQMYSVTKSMTCIAIGMLLDDGKLSLDDPIVKYFPDYLPEHPDERLLRLKIRDMLRMATCYRRTTYREGVDENWAKTFFTATPTHEPGTVFHYDTSCAQVLCALVERLSGMSEEKFLTERLLKPIGCEDGTHWLTDPSGCCRGGTGMCMSLRDMHKVAQWMLDGGRRLISADFLRQMTEKHINTTMQTNEEERYGYCWQCWRTRNGWALYGMGGQLAVVCPEKQVILTTIADTRLDPFGVQRIYNAFFEELYPAIGQANMPFTAYQLKTQHFASYPTEKTPTGRYIFAPENPLHLRWMVLDGNCLRYENDCGVVELPFLPGENLPAKFPGWDAQALVSAGWTEDGMLHLRCNEIQWEPCGFELLLCFQDNRLTVQARCCSSEKTRFYDGVATGICNA